MDHRGKLERNRPKKGRRFAERTERERYGLADSRIVGCTSILAEVLKPDKPANDRPRGKDLSVRIQCRDHRANIFDTVHQVRSCNYDNVCSPQSFRGLAQSALWDMPAAGWIGRVDADDIEVTPGPSMLKSIIKYESGNPETLYRPPRRADAIGVGDNDHFSVDQHLGEFDRFVAAGRGIDKHTDSIGNQDAPPWVPPPVTAGQDANRVTPLSEHAGDVGDQWRFARPASRYIADTDGARTEVVRVENALVI
jgi:hypothetical protein